VSAFYVLAAILAVVAVALLTRPGWWSLARRRSPPMSARVQALSVQLRQLKSLHDAGTLENDSYQQARRSVERQLVDAISDPAVAPAVTGRPSPALVAGLAVFVLAIAAGGYAWLGSPDRLSSEHASVAAAASAPHPLDTKEVEGMISRLADRLKDSPDDAEGWQMLARSYVVIGRHPEAIDAFRRALELRPDDAGLLADYADALAVTQNRKIEGEPLALVERALKADPKNPKALALAGTAAFDRRDYASAISYWERAVEVESPGSTLSEQLRGGIAEARQLAGVPPAPADAAAKDAAPVVAAAGAKDAASGARITGTVSLADSLRANVSPDDTLFVFARAVDGPRMPLAILRKRVRDLPLQFTLDDSLAMSPDAKLSSAARVVVGARVSKSGNAMPQPGDLQGFAAESAVGASGVRIVIDQTVSK
jgi:cytochrome c-type biogenesis protein CcmH